VAQKMQAEEPQIVFRAQDSDVEIAELDELRPLEDTICLTLVEFAETKMQIYDRPYRFDGLKSSAGGSVVVT